MDKLKRKIILLEIFIIILSILMIYCIISLFLIELLFGIISIIMLFPYIIGIIFMNRLVRVD